MQSKNIDVTRILINIDSSIEELLTVLNKQVNPNFGSGFAIVVNKDKHIIGIVQDSDLRKYLLKRPNDDLKISDFVRRDFISVNSTLNSSEMINSIINQMNLRNKWKTFLPVKIIPIIENNTPIGLIDVQELKQALTLRNSQLVVFGMGYVGLTLTLAFAQLGKPIYGYDIDPKKVENLRSGNSHIFEVGIEKILKSKIGKNLFIDDNLSFLNKDFGIQRIFIICTGSPIKEDGSADLQQIESSVEKILEVIKPLDTIIMRSTVPVGTGAKIIDTISNTFGWNVGTDFHYVSAPERTVEGNALAELRELPQIIAGATEDCLVLGSRIFREISNSVISLEKIEAAEMTKLMGNAFRDYIFGFANHMIEIAKRYNLDLNELIKASNHAYPRSMIPQPSPGVGGPCLTKDSFLLYESVSDQSDSPILAARRTNLNTPSKMVNFIQSKILNLNNFNCLAIGVTFKGYPETNDIRNSTPIEFIDILRDKVNSIITWDAMLSESQLEALNLGKSSDFNMFAILNNNIKNKDYFFDKFSRTSFQEIVIVDPWRLLNYESLTIESFVKTIHYFSLSHYKVLKAN